MITLQAHSFTRPEHIHGGLRALHYQAITCHCTVGAGCNHTHKNMQRSDVMCLVAEQGGITAPRRRIALWMDLLRNYGVGVQFPL